jgi:hypothetical protein
VPVPHDESTSHVAGRHDNDPDTQAWLAGMRGDFGRAAGYSHGYVRKVTAGPKSVMNDRDRGRFGANRRRDRDGGEDPFGGSPSAELHPGARSAVSVPLSAVQPNDRPLVALIAVGSASVPRRVRSRPPW